MKRILIITILCTLCIGCTGRYQHQMDQSLLLQENQRLEEALYVTHAQLIDLKRENEAIKNVKSSAAGSLEPVVTPALRSQRYEPMPRDDYDEAPPYQAPQITIPDDAPVMEMPPESLKGGLIIPPWSPTRK